MSLTETRVVTVDNPKVAKGVSTQVHRLMMGHRDFGCVRTDVSEVDGKEVWTVVLEHGLRLGVAAKTEVVGKARIFVEGCEFAKRHLL